MNSPDPSFLMVNWERRSEKGFAYDFNYTYSGLKFNPGVGFVMMGGVQGVNAGLNYGWFPGEKSKLFNYRINIRGERYSRLEDGKLESMRISPGLEINTKKDLHAELSLEIQQEGVLNDFNLSDSIKISAGNYSFTVGQIMFGTSDSRMLSIMGDLNVGQFYDGNRIGLMAGPNLNLSSSLKLLAMYQFEAIRFPERATYNSLNIHSVNLKALYMFSTKLSASVLLQYVNTYDELIGNFRLRYNPREGNDFYLVYNDFRSIDIRNSVPVKPSFFNKTIMVKYTHTSIW
jgi:hypothetical protein